MSDRASTAAADAVIVVVTTCPDEAVAERIARGLVETRLAACASVGSVIRSHYRWQGKVEHATEVPVWIKTRRDRYGEVEAAIRSWHPYEVPEIVAWSVAAGSAAYLRWVIEEADADPFGTGGSGAVA